MDPGTGSRRHKQLTSGQDTWSARCGESRTAGAEGGLRETTGGNTGTAPAGLPYKAALAFTPPGDTRATEDQVTAWGLDILAGNSRGVIAGITARAAADPPRPGGEHAKNIRKTTHYLQAREPFLGYPAALAKGWPIATGIIEGACRHIIGDRLGITGARWSLAGAQAMLWMRAIAASSDLPAYWNWHIAREHHRNHLSKLQNPPTPQHALGLAA
jgi:hypothetical protein